MSRTSPSGPNEATDLKRLLFALNSSFAAGTYFIISEEGFAAPVLNTGALIDVSPIFVDGLMTRKGRIGFARLATGLFSGTPTGTATLQWQVNNVLKGNAVSIPFSSPAVPGNALPTDLAQEVVDFGEVDWVEGDFVQLVLKTTAFGGSGELVALLAYEIELEGGRPRA